MNLLAFEPILKRIRWGGRRLGSRLKKPIGDADDYAESWEVADHGEDQSLVLDGPLQGKTLHWLVRERGKELFGKHAGQDQFPLLVKFLDANDRLSVQVHPNDAQAVQFDPRERGKTEAWVILEAAHQSRLYAGLKSNIDAEALKTHLQDGTVEDCLHSFEVTAGDCIFIPAGTVHAIGEGILLAEIQQSSDITFRLYDWGRTGSDGKPRPLHIDEALQCIDFDRGPVDPVTPQTISDNDSTVEELVRSDYFVLRRYQSGDHFAITHDDRFHILMLLEGTAELVCGDERKQVETGQTVLMPAEAPDVGVVPDGNIILLESFLPD